MIATSAQSAGSWYAVARSVSGRQVRTQVSVGWSMNRSPALRGAKLWGGGPVLVPFARSLAAASSPMKGLRVGRVPGVSAALKVLRALKVRSQSSYVGQWAGSL